MASRYQAWQRRLDTIEDAGRTRTLRTLAPTGPTTGLLEGRPVIVACSNDYLGLGWANRGPLQAPLGGSGASRLISGTRPVHQELEDALEDLFGRPALLFNSGYQANLAVFSTLLEPGQTWASDALNHASIIDGLRLGRAHRTVVPHADPEAIGPVDAVVVEGLYSMDGDVPPLERYPTEPWLCVDEAHAVGCLGPDGRGAAAAAGRVPDVLIGTFGKAYGAAGAFVVGPPELKQLLVNAGRSFIFSTAPTEETAARALLGLRTASEERRERLAHRSAAFRQMLRDRGWSPLGNHHIVPVVTGPATMALAEQLLEKGVFATGIRYPTVPAGQERIRFTLSADHTTEQLEVIANALGRIEDAPLP